jgi:hypothetical protein
MREKMTALDAVCARANPRLLLTAIALGLLNVAVAAQRLGAVLPAGTAAEASFEKCSPVLPPELREMAGQD